MGEISINPKFNIHETYKKVRILNPYRNSGAPSGGVMPRSENLIRFYKFNETTGDAIDEIGTQNGVLYNTIVRDGSSYEGNGTNAYVDAGFTSETTKYSIATRIMTGADVSGVKFIASKYINSSDRSVYFYISSGRFAAQSGSVLVLSSGITPNTAYEIVITCNNESLGTIKIYLTKALEHSRNTEIIPATNIPLNLFRRNYNAYYANVKIDYFAMWDVELTQAEIDTIPEGSL